MKRSILLYEQWKQNKFSKKNRVFEADENPMSTFIQQAPNLYAKWIQMAKNSALADAKTVMKTNVMPDFYAKMEKGIKQDMQPFFGGEGDTKTRATSFYTSALTYIGGVYNHYLDKYKSELSKDAETPGGKNLTANYQKAAEEWEKKANDTLNTFIKQGGENMANDMNKNAINKNVTAVSPAK